MLCPRCEQGDVIEVRVKANGIHLFVCQECEASWFLFEKIGVEPFIDYGTYMEGLGLPPLWSELEVVGG